MIYLSVVIPAYNEQKRILPTLKSVVDFLKKQDYESEIIVVDDGSRDETVKTVLSFQAETKFNLKIITNEENHGKGYVVRKGMLAAEGQYILFMDADSSTKISEIEKLLPYIKEYPVIIGSRYLQAGSIKIKQPLGRRILSRIGNLLIRIILGLNFVDTQCGFKLLQKRAGKKIFRQMTLDRWGFDFEMLALAKKYHYNSKEIAVDWYDDKKSKFKLSQAFRTMSELLKIRINLWKGQYN